MRMERNTCLIACFLQFPEESAMSEQLVIQSDRETLTRVLLEILALLQSSGTTSTLSTLRALARVQWLLISLCSSHLSATEVTSGRQTLGILRDQIRHATRGASSDRVSIPASIHR